MIDARTESGIGLAEQAVSAAAENSKHIGEDVNRQIFAKYQVINTVLGFISPKFNFSPKDAYANITNMQSMWANGRDGDGGSGEILLKISGLLDIDSSKLLNPKGLPMMGTIRKAAIEVARNGRLARFIEKNLPIIGKEDPELAGNIRYGIGIDESDPTVDNLQQSIDKFKTIVESE